MSVISKALFWIFTIGLGFVNPLISVGLVILYYLPGIISDICQPCNDIQDESRNSGMKSYSEDVLEDMK